MKRIITIIAVIIGIGYFNSDSHAATPVMETIQGTATVQGVAISTSAATRVDTIWVSGKSRAWIRISNLDSTASIYCGFDTDVVAVAGLKVGEKIVAGGNAAYSVGRDIKLYCKSDGTAATWAAVAQFGY